MAYAISAQIAIENTNAPQSHKQRINRIISGKAYKANLEEKQNLLREKRTSLYEQIISWIKNLFTPDKPQRDTPRQFVPPNMTSGSGLPAQFIYWILILLACGLLVFILMKFSFIGSGKKRKNKKVPSVNLPADLPWASSIEQIYQYYLKQSSPAITPRLPPNLTLYQAITIIRNAGKDDENIVGLTEFLERRLFRMEKPNQAETDHWQKWAVTRAGELSEISP